MQLVQLENVLSKHIPAKSSPYLASLIAHYKVHLTIKWNRQSKFGDYRVPRKGEQHRITINNALNKYAFLITLVHELAHLTTFLKYGFKVADHGADWKQEFKMLMQPLLHDAEIFPADVQRAMILYMNNPKASSCSDVHLMKTLNQHNVVPSKHVSDLALGTHFVLHNNSKIFRLDKKLRKNFLCKEIHSGLNYRISSIAEVKQVIEIVP